MMSQIQFLFFEDHHASHWKFAAFFIKGVAYVGCSIKKFNSGNTCTPSIISGLTYSISRNIDSDFNLAIWWSRKDHQINLHHYRSIYITCMGFSLYSNEIRKFKIPSTAFSKHTAKYNIQLYFCFYSIKIAPRTYHNSLPEPYRMDWSVVRWQVW